ncbi:hypothetical protein JG687_00010123, partial [Phytophthora cactorum]
MDEKAEQARLMFFSDHCMSDGYSSMVVLNVILEQVTSLATKTQPAQVQEFPLRPSFYDMWLSKKPLLKALMKGVISMLGKAIYRSELKKFHPVLPARADRHASFAEGDPTSMRKALKKCKDESVTFGGAVVCATLFAFYHAAKAFKFVIDFDYKMRRHVPHPVEEDPVRTYVTFRYSGVACLRRRQPENYSILGPRATSE